MIFRYLINIYIIFQFFILLYYIFFYYISNEFVEIQIQCRSLRFSIPYFKLNKQSPISLIDNHINRFINLA
jgi:hypothetical protein